MARTVEPARRAARLSRPSSRRRPRAARAAVDPVDPHRPHPGQVIEPDVLEADRSGDTPSAGQAPLEPDRDVAQADRAVAGVEEGLGDDADRVGEVDDPRAGRGPPPTARPAPGRPARCAAPWRSRRRRSSPGRSPEAAAGASRRSGAPPGRRRAAGRARNRRPRARRPIAGEDQPPGPTGLATMRRARPPRSASLSGSMSSRTGWGSSAASPVGCSTGSAGAAGWCSPAIGARSMAPLSCSSSSASAARPPGSSTRRCRPSSACVGQETTGAGGLAKALRTVPARARVGRAGRRRAAPDAWIVDFTNPVGIVTQALLDGGHRALGLCNVAIGFQRSLAEQLRRRRRTGSSSTTSGSTT